MSDPEFVFAPMHATMVVEEGSDLFQEALTPACDFCLDTRIKWEYPCERFVIEHLRYASDGGWLACERCSEMIEKGDFGGLSARSLRSWIARHGTMPQGDLDSLAEIQHGFFDHRQGLRIPYG